MRLLVISIDLLDTVIEVSSQCPSLESCVIMDVIPNSFNIPEDPPIVIFTMKQIEDIGKQNRLDTIETAEDDILTLTYTSGSTGLPKGCIITDKNWKYIYTNITFNHPIPNVNFTFSISARDNNFINIAQGGRIGLFSEDTSRIFEDIRHIAPAYLNAPPTIWNKLHSTYQELLADKLQVLDTNTITAEEYNELKETIYAKIRELLGGRVNVVMTGGALTSKEVYMFLRKCFKGRALVWDSYGSSEIGGIANNGELLPDVRARLIDRDQYKVTD
eukprot:TRINITY_DN2387_c0_g1_i2.p1 TRINITY_DN2387_c0_g1~~TRINITY_DN2387_c0_g1_i2.p1  ORF type:complete len:274 (+),score=49.86 TRINITY_DN2387_c0_g1_i2:839-1660(+)